MRKDDHLIFEAFKNKGLSDTEYHQARKDAYEGAGEQLGHGPIQVRLNKDTIMDCYKAGTVQGVTFAKGTIFNCDENAGDYYECDTEEYGTVAVFPDDVTVLSGEENAESADARKERTQRKWQMNKNRWAKWKMENPEAAAKHAAKKQGKSEDAEHESHGYPGGVTAIQNTLINQLKKHGFTLTKISHADKERDKYPTVFMKKSQGAMHKMAEIDGMGQINGEPYKEYLASLNTHKYNRSSGLPPEDPEDPYYDTWQSIAQDHAEDAEGVSAAFHYDPMPGLEKTANQIRDLLQGAANDEARTEHIIKMAQTILGDPTEYDKNEYRKMLDGLIVLLNRFIVVPMN